MDGSAKVNRVGVAAAVQSYKDTRLPKGCTLLDSAASVHVCHTKERFSNFRRPKGKRGLLCGGGLVPIEGWGEVALPIKVENQTSVLLLKNVAYISNFSLNLVSLGVLEDQGFDWTPRSGQIQNNKLRIIGYTVRRGNNYKIGNSTSNIATVLIAQLPKSLKRCPGYVVAGQKEKSPTDNKNTPLNSLGSHIVQAPKPNILIDRESTCTQNRLHATASPDTWHCRMGHIGPLGLYKLGKKCLGVKLHGKSMSQCSHCALSKMSQQISRLPPANKSTRLFHRIFVDWLDLKEGWDTYQGDGAVVRRVIVVICEATGMAVTYFTQSAKEDKNLPLTRDFVAWMAL